MHLRESFYRRQRRKQRFELGLQPLRYLRFLLWIFLSPPYRIFTEDSEGNKDWIGFEPLRSLRFLLLISFTSCFAELAGRLNGICRVDQSKPRLQISASAKKPS